MHTPVLLKEVIDGLNVKPNGLYIDATFGEGGHLIEMVKRGGKVLGIDWDNNQIKKLKSTLSKIEGLKIKNYKNIKLSQGNFADIEKIAKNNEFYPVDGILFDLGLSIRQIENSKRGFSYKQHDEPLDMRINEEISETAADLVNSLQQNQIYELLARYGEEVNSLAISRAIVRTRSLKKIITVGDLTGIIDKVRDQKDRKTYARVFQALRIAVNSELENLKKGLEGALRVVKLRGRIVVISFHSLEDRIVKQFIRLNKLKQRDKKVIRSDKEKVFERSAKLRIIIC